jgi:hypothetical protein
MIYECVGSSKPALPSDLLHLNRNDLVRCCDCGAAVAVWLQDGQWIRGDHESGVDTDEPEMAAMVRDSVGGAAIRFDDDPGL